MFYLELNEIKAKLNIEGTDYDTVLSSLIEQITSEIDSYLGKNLALYSTTEIVDSNGNNKLYVKNIISDIEKIEDRKTGIIYEYDFFENYIIYLKNKIPKSQKSILVEYKTGYNEVPTDIKNIAFNLLFGELIETTIDIKSKILESLKQKKIKSQKIGNLSITYFGETEKNLNGINKLDFSNPKNIERILNKYKSFSGLY